MGMRFLALKKGVLEMSRLFLILAEGESGSSTSGGTTEKLKEFFTNMVKSPIFYIVLAAIILLIIGVYLLRRVIKPQSGVIKVVVRKGKIYKLIDENSQKYFLVPFTDSVAAIISLGDREFSSDKLYINNGPDALYKINYTLNYKVTDVTKYFPYRDNFQNVVTIKINDELREYADKGHALDIVKDYRDHSGDILSLLNKVTEEYGVECASLKVNFIEPMGNK